MELTHWGPFKDLKSLQDRMNRLFNESARPSELWTLQTEKVADATDRWVPAIDVCEDEQTFVLTAEVPGMDIKDLDLQIQDRVLILKGVKQQHQETREDHYHRVERTYGSFQRSMTLPGQVDPEKVKAKLKNGVLEIQIPKLKETGAQRIPVES